MENCTHNNVSWFLIDISDLYKEGFGEIQMWDSIVDRLNGHLETFKDEQNYYLKSKNRKFHQICSALKGLNVL